MRLATWNVNGLRARLDFVLLWLKERRPDVVGLQELKLTDEQFPHEEVAAAGYRAIPFGQKAWNGVAVLGRTDTVESAGFVEEDRGLDGQEHFGSRRLTVRLGDLRFTTVYVPNGKSVEHDDYPKKLEWLDALIRAESDTAGETVLCGDFNLCPTGQDSWNEEKLAGRIFHTDAERDRWRGFEAAGWIDLYREKHPDATEFSWWDYRAGAFHKNMGLRIDFVLGSRAVADRVTDVWIDRDYRKKKDGLTASDHAPVIADLA